MVRYTKVILTVIAIALVWLCLWGLGPKWGTPAEAAAGTAQSAGRYQIFMSPTWRGDLFMVDTASGRIWRCVTSKRESGLLCWEPMGYVRDHGDVLKELELSPIP